MDASVARSRLPKEDRMEQTLLAAHDLFAVRGYAAVKMDDIAAAVGVTKPLLYNYLGNKEQLYIACMERAGDSLTKTVAESVGESADRVGDYRGVIVELVSGSLLAQLPQDRRDSVRVEFEALSTTQIGAAEALARW